MYKITALCPGDEIQKDDEPNPLSAFEAESATTLIISAGEDVDALELIVGFCKMIADGELKSLTVTKEDNTQTEV